MKYYFSWLIKKAHKEKMASGFGIVAIEKIKKGEKVIVFGGYVFTKKQFDTLSKKMKTYPFQLDDELYFGLSKYSEVEEPDYLNHSCEPNCGFVGEITIAAMRDINVGEQISIDYAMCSTQKRSLTSDMKKCLCGSNICRGKITSNDWKIKKLQKKYKGFFHPFLEKKFKI
ncbi:MAG: SET domain-containing protein-lysine N-methyltransferase [Candidatus Paceibacterota bacterium]